MDGRTSRQKAVQGSGKKIGFRIKYFLAGGGEGELGFELRASCLQSRCSTA
jgi:hypothetical protein